MYGATADAVFFFAMIRLHVFFFFFWFTDNTATFFEMQLKNAPKRGFVHKKKLGNSEKTEEAWLYLAVSDFKDQVILFKVSPTNLSES